MSTSSENEEKRSTCGEPKVHYVMSLPGTCSQPCTECGWVKTYGDTPMMFWRPLTELRAENRRLREALELVIKRG